MFTDEENIDYIKTKWEDWEIDPWDNPNSRLRIWWVKQKCECWVSLFHQIAKNVKTWEKYYWCNWCRALYKTL